MEREGEEEDMSAEFRMVLTVSASLRLQYHKELGCFGQINTRASGANKHK